MPLSQEERRCVLSSKQGQTKSRRWHLRSAGMTAQGEQAYVAGVAALYHWSRKRELGDRTIRTR